MGGCDTQNLTSRVRVLAFQNFQIHYTIFADLEPLGKDVPCFDSVSQDDTTCVATMGSVEVGYSLLEDSVEVNPKEVVMNTLKEEVLRNGFKVEGIVNMSVFDIPEDNQSESSNTVGQSQRDPIMSDTNKSQFGMDKIIISIGVGSGVLLLAMVVFVVTKQKHKSFKKGYEKENFDSFPSDKLDNESGSGISYASEKKSTIWNSIVTDCSISDESHSSEVNDVVYNLEVLTEESFDEEKDNTEISHI